MSLGMVELHLRKTCTELQSQTLTPLVGRAVRLLTTALMTLSERTIGKLLNCKGGLQAVRVMCRSRLLRPGPLKICETGQPVSR
jgi:hypothetical protein